MHVYYATCTDVCQRVLSYSSVHVCKNVQLIIKSHLLGIKGMKIVPENAFTMVNGM